MSIPMSIPIFRPKSAMVGSSGVGDGVGVFVGDSVIEDKVGVFVGKGVADGIIVGAGNLVGFTPQAARTISAEVIPAIFRKSLRASLNLSIY